MDKMPIEQLQLSTRALNALHHMGIYYAEDLLNVSLEDISQQSYVGNKTINEIKRAKRSIKKEYKISEDEKRKKHRTFTDDQIQEMSLHNVSELKLSERASNTLRREGYSKIDQVVILSEEEIQDFKGCGAKSAKEIVNAINQWLKDNYIVNSKKVDYYELLKLDVYGNTFKNISYALEPLFHIYWEKLFHWAYDVDIIDQIDISDETEISDKNISIVLGFPFLQETLKSFWLRISNQGVIEIDKAENYLNELHLSFNTQIIIDKSIENKIICKYRDCILIKREKLDNFISHYKIDNKRDLHILKKRLNGSTLQDIGDVYSISRERIRQITNKCIRKFPLLFEDYFSQPYEAFHISKQEFKRLFPEVTSEGYEYLTIRYKHGTDSLDENSLSSYNGNWKGRLDAYCKEEINRLDKLARGHIPRIKMVLRVLINYADTPMTMKEFEKKYYDYILDKDYPFDKLQINLRTIENYLRNTEGVVFNQENKVRYCNVDPKAIWNLIDFSAYKNSVISTEIIYKDYQEQMENFDIRDGYELFCVIKTSLNNWKENFNIKCRRIPMLVIGDASDKEQALKLLKELSPIDYREYYDIYQERYGLKSDSARANPRIYNALLPYYSNGKYIIDVPLIAKEDIDNFTATLWSKDIWFIDEIEELFKKVCVHSSSDAINPAAFRRTGYTLYSGYALSNKYKNTNDYLDQEIFSQEYIDLQQLDIRLTRLPIFRTVLDKKRKALDYIETTPNSFISLKKFHEVYGLTRHQIKQLQSSLKEIQSQAPYFNADSIWVKIQDSPLVQQLKDNKWMLTNIMRQQEGIYTLRVPDNFILSYDNKSLNISQICKWLVSINGKMTINTLQKKFNETFGSTITSYRIAEKLRASGIWDEVVTDSIDDYIESLVNLTNVDDLLKEEFF